MNKHILFRVGNQIFAIPISSTDRVVHIENLTIIPDMSSHIIGIQDVEGTITPLVDLTERFFSEKIQDLKKSDTIIVHWKNEKIGLTVNEVLSVETYYENQISDKVDMEKVEGIPTSYISAFVQTDEEIIPILDPQLLFDDEQAKELQALLKIEQINDGH
ncbi:chemotaxis protein CheW [Marinilactibacillus psychrotolerans]|uniref:chemotaxis protein CheW n=1 Tax=Marinilactibacillus psychrotolerans TaxID=191770 RepID=UPI00388633A9